MDTGVASVPKQFTDFAHFFVTTTVEGDQNYDKVQSDSSTVNKPK